MSELRYVLLHGTDPQGRPVKFRIPEDDIYLGWRVAELLPFSESPHGSAPPSGDETTPEKTSGETD